MHDGLIDRQALIAEIMRRGIYPPGVRHAIENAPAIDAVEVKEFEDITIDRLRELAQADKVGRCVVLPCNVGDTVWICGSVRGVYSAKVRTFFIGRPSLWGSPDNSIQMIRTTECDIPTKDFGKTVFLTREEAEMALDGVRNG